MEIFHKIQDELINDQEKINKQVPLCKLDPLSRGGGGGGRDILDQPLNVILDL